MSNQSLKLGFLASGRGSNLQAILDACQQGSLQATPAVVISNNPAAVALQRAREAGIAARHLSHKTQSGAEALDRAIKDTLTEHGVDLVVLAGYMKKLGPATLTAFRHRIINIHPSLLPKFAGQGMYGMHVHEAVIAAGEKETGVTIHLVDEEYDQGQVLAQESVQVHTNDTPQSLAARVLDVEHRLYVSTIQQIINGSLKLPTV